MFPSIYNHSAGSKEPTTEFEEYKDNPNPPYQAVVGDRMVVDGNDENNRTLHPAVISGAPPTTSNDPNDPNQTPNNSNEDVNADTEGQVVLHSLENAIEVTSKTDTPPTVEPHEIGPPVRIGDVLPKFKYPLYALSFAGCSAVFVIYSQNPTYYRYFPYYACIVNYCGGVPSTKASLDSMGSTLVTKYEEMEVRIRAAASNTTNVASEAYGKYSDYLQKKKEAAMEWVTAKKSYQGGAFSMLTFKPYDPPKDMDQLLDKSEVTGEQSNTTSTSSNTTPSVTDEEQQPPQPPHDSLHRAYSTRRNNNRFVPLSLRSEQNFFIMITFPILTLLLLINLFIVFCFQRLKGPHAEDVIRNKWSPLGLSAQTFILICIQITIAYLLCRASRTASIVNHRARKRSKELNMFNWNVARVMKILRDRLLALIQFVGKVLSISGGVGKHFGNLFGNNKRLTLGGGGQSK